MQRYSLQKSTTQDGWWTLADSVSGVKCSFEEHNFYRYYRVVETDDGALPLDTTRRDALNAMADWAAAYHLDIVTKAPKETEQQRLGRIITYHRRFAGLSLRQLAAKANIPYSNLCNIERGKYNASVEVLSKVLAALGKKLSVVDDIE